MKKLLLLLTIITLAFMTSCDKGGSDGSTGSLPLTNEADSASYALGLSLAQYVNTMKKDLGDEFEFNLDVMNNAMREGVAENARLTEAEIPAIMKKVQQKAQQAVQARMSKEAEVNIAPNQAFLAENATKEGVQTTASGLQYKILQEGSGDHPTAADQVTVHYTGKLIDGSVFDSSHKTGQPATFSLGRVIPGWTEGIQLMNPGAKFEFYIPSGLGYGPQGSPSRGGSPGIPGNSTLIFEVDFISTTPAVTK